MIDMGHDYIGSSRDVYRFYLFYVYLYITCTGQSWKRLNTDATKSSHDTKLLEKNQIQS